MTERLVVIGADAAGMSAASQARRLRSPDDLAIVAFERGSTSSYAACGIPYWVAGIIDEREKLVARTPAQFREGHDIDVRVHHEVVAIDTDARTVRVREVDGAHEFDEPYDTLLIATGATPRRPNLPGIDGAGVFGVQTLDDGERVLDALDDTNVRRVVVIGAGYIGIEMAEAMCLRGLEVHVVDGRPQPMPSLDTSLGERVADAMRANGIHLHLDAQAQGIERDADGRVTGVATADETVPADMVVLGLGTRPFSDLAEEAGVPIGETGGIIVDRRQRTPVDGVWAAGDCAQTVHRVSGAPVAVALGTVANRQGRIAGLGIGGRYATFPGVLGTAITRICELEIGITGLGSAQAADAGFETLTETIESTTRAGYHPGADPIVVSLLAERRTGRLLGAQIVGGDNSAKRIDVLATAVWNAMTVDELAETDLSYAPPFSPVWDPVLIAARRAGAAVHDDLTS